MQHHEAIDALEALIPEIRKTKDPEYTLLKHAGSENLAFAQLEKLGQLFNTAKTLTFMDKRTDRGGDFELLDVPGMMQKYATLEVNPDAHPSSEKSASVDGYIEHDPYSFGHDFKAVEGKRQNFKEASVKAESVARDILGITKSAVENGHIDQFRAECQFDMMDIGGSLVRSHRIHSDLPTILEDAQGLYGTKVASACDYILNCASAQGFKLEKPAATKPLYRDSTGKAELVLKVATKLSHIGAALTILKEAGAAAPKEKEKKSPKEETFNDVVNEFMSEAAKTKKKEKEKEPSKSIEGGFGTRKREDMGKELGKAPGYNFPNTVMELMEGDSISSSGRNNRQEVIDDAAGEEQFSANVMRLAMTDPVISDASDRAVSNAANSLRQAYPGIGANMADMRWMLREVLQYDMEEGTVPSHIIADLQRRQNMELGNRKAERQERTDMYGGSSPKKD